MKVNLNKIKDGLNGGWWHYISSEDLGFVKEIPDLDNCVANLEDVFIHKKIETGERFPTIKYHLVAKAGPKLFENKDAKELLGKKMVSFVKKNDRLPFACSFGKAFKNGKVQINYQPANSTSFALKINPAEFDIDNGETYFDNLDTTDTNPIKSASGKTQTRKTWQVPSNSDPSKVYTVTNADGKWKCTCPQFVFRKKQCKHIQNCMYD